MLNFCVFTFILYAVEGSVRTILFGNKAKSSQQRCVRNKAYKKSAATTPTRIKATKIHHKNNSTKRLGTSPKRFAFI